MIDQTGVSHKSIDFLASNFARLRDINIQLCIYSHKPQLTIVDTLASKPKLITYFGKTIFSDAHQVVHSSDKFIEELIFHESIASMFDYYLKRCPGSQLYHEKVNIDLGDSVLIFIVLHIMGFFRC